MSPGNPFIFGQKLKGRGTPRVNVKNIAGVGLCTSFKSICEQRDTQAYQAICCIQCTWYNYLLLLCFHPKTKESFL